MSLAWHSGHSLGLPWRSASRTVTRPEKVVLDRKTKIKARLVGLALVPVVVVVYAFFQTFDF